MKGSGVTHPLIVGSRKFPELKLRCNKLNGASFMIWALSDASVIGWEHTHFELHTAVICSVRWMLVEPSCHNLALVWPSLTRSHANVHIWRLIQVTWPTSNRKWKGADALTNHSQGGWKPKVTIGRSHHEHMAQQRSSSSQGDVNVVDGDFQYKDNKRYSIKVIKVLFM